MRLGEGIHAVEYNDGALEVPNPSWKGYESIRRERKSPESIVSIGSGISLSQMRRSRATYYLGVLNIKRDQIVRFSDSIEFDVLQNAAALGAIKYYIRLNVQEGLSNILLDEWKGKKGRDTLKIIREKTENYLCSSEVKDQLVATARVLVNSRRERASTGHWERFCHGTEYVCTVINCNDSRSIHKERQDLRHHLEVVHHIDSSSIETLLDQGRRLPLYAAKNRDNRQGSRTI